MFGQELPFGQLCWKQWVFQKTLWVTLWVLEQQKKSLVLGDSQVLTEFANYDLESQDTNNL